MIKISIIIPIYNGEKYIRDLLYTLQNQTYKNLEIIFVDDLSTDNSVEVIESALHDDHRIILLKREDKGGFAAKGIEYGFKYCTGDYFWFMSHDDFLDLDFFEKCVRKIEYTKADVIVPNCILYRQGTEIKKTFEFPVNGNYNCIIENLAAYEKSLDWKLHGNTLRKVELVKKLGVEAKYYNSDEVNSRLSYLYAEKIVFVDTNFYYRQDNVNAITKTLKWFMVDLLSTDILLFKELEKNTTENELLNKHLSRLNKSFFYWYRLFVKCRINPSKYKSDKDKNIYMKQSLKKNREILLELNRKYAAKYKERLVFVV